MVGAAVIAASSVSATIKVVLGTVVSLASDRTSLVLGFEKELERLSQFATVIRGFLADTDDKIHSAAVQVWLNQLEEELFKAEDVLDELNYEKLRREVKYRNQLKKKVCFFFSYFSTIGLHSKLASKVREINANLERINQQAKNLGLVDRFQTDAALPATARATTSRLTDSIVAPDVVGRAKDESNIVEMLLSPTESVVSVIPITGMGGIGKTTLAKSVYNNPQIGRHFGKNKFWVCVAREIKIMELFKVLLVQLTGEEVKVDDRNLIVTRIGDQLGRQKYFLVLDDVWNHEQELWNDFFTTLEGLNATKGSWCLVTTRLEQVTNSVSGLLKMNDGPYFLGKLSHDDCWSILIKKVLTGEEVSKELEALKKQILRKCDGLPLAAKLIGGLLLTNGKEKWQSIVEESLLNEDQGDIKQILKVSFDHLSPASLKKCFAYCSIFPQDTKLIEHELIEHWIAEGFVLSDRKDKRVMEEIGGEYLRILFENSLLEKVEVWMGTCYKMHDLVHDFARSVLNPESSNQGRYLALMTEMAENSIMTIPTSLRTLFLHLQSDISADMNMLSRFKHLHVLKLSGDCVESLPSSIGKLLHLRLLDISSSGITSLPESLCKLYILQTLTIDDDELEGGFPKRMSDLISLRHLNYYHGDAKFKMPMQMRQLTCLQTLKFFNVSQEKGCGIEELGTLKYLKGSLEIRNLRLVKHKEAAKQAKLFEKPNLSRLWLDFEWNIRNQESDSCDEDVLEGLQPHQNLQELEILYFMGNKFPQWFVNLSKLVELWIENCKRCSELPSLGQLPSLKRLYLNRLENIQSVGDEFYGITTNEEGEQEGRSRASGSSTRRRKFFPALEELRVAYMENLVEWKEAEADVFPTLKDLTLICCNNLRELPEDVIGSSLQRLTVEYCPGLISLGANGQKCPLPCLELLKIGNCPQLTTLPCGGKSLYMEKCHNLTSIRTGHGTASVEDLRIRFCDNLRELPENAFGSSLRRLIIDGCPRLISVGVNGQKCLLPCLEELSIDNCDGLTTISDKMFESCPSLRSLWVKYCPNLVLFSLNLQEISSLEELILINCPKLIPHRFKGFDFATSLRKLNIGPFSSYDSSINDFEWSGLRSASTLTKLCLRGLPHTESLPHQLQYLTTLTSLSLENFGGIEVLPDWIGNLVSLQILSLWSCQKLQSLPSEAAMRRLTKLSRVVVLLCPLLRQRYTPQRGIYLDEEISSDPTSNDSEQEGNDGVQTSVSCCFSSLLKKEKPGES